MTNSIRCVDICILGSSIQAEDPVMISLHSEQSFYKHYAHFLIVSNVQQLQVYCASKRLIILIHLTSLLHMALYGSSKFIISHLVYDAKNGWMDGWIDLDLNFLSNKFMQLLSRIIISAILVILSLWVGFVVVFIVVVSLITIALFCFICC